MDMSSELPNADTGGAIHTAHREGVVIQKNSGFYRVQTGDEALLCEVSARLRKTLVHTADNPSASRRSVRRVAHAPADPVVVGDRVRYLPAALDAAGGLIVEVLPRRSHISRRFPSPTPGGHAFEQIIAANLDQAVAVLAAARPEPKWNLLDRYLVAAEAIGLPALICLTKTDLALDRDGRLSPEIDAALDDYRRIDYRVTITGALSGLGLDDLRLELANRTSVLIGKSGVGKTSLLNALQSGSGRRVGEVSRQTGKGRHTTSWLEMVPLDGGGALIDTPGTREFGLWDVPAEDLAQHFPEMRPFLGRCKFGDSCRHDEEPGCAVRRAVMNGDISPRRYHSYLRLATEG